jgi:hypothetical protein
MGEKSDQLERHIRDERNELGQHISELRQKVKSAVDWRVQFKERPMTMIGLAFGGGILLSAFLPNMRPHSNGRKGLSERNRLRVSLERESNPKIESKTETMRPEGGASAWEKASDTLDTVRGALFAVAGTKVVNYLDQVIPGFNEQYIKSKARRANRVVSDV